MRRNGSAHTVINNDAILQTHAAVLADVAVIVVEGTPEQLPVLANRKFLLTSRAVGCEFFLQQ